LDDGMVPPDSVVVGVLRGLPLGIFSFSCCCLVLTRN
jgi:hypothetical protein